MPSTTAPAASAIQNAASARTQSPFQRRPERMSDAPAAALKTLPQAAVLLAPDAHLVADLEWVFRAGLDGLRLIRETDEIDLVPVTPTGRWIGLGGQTKPEDAVAMVGHAHHQQALRHTQVKLDGAGQHGPVGVAMQPVIGKRGRHPAAAGVELEVHRVLVRRPLEGCGSADLEVQVGARVVVGEPVFARLPIEEDAAGNERDDAQHRRRALPNRFAESRPAPATPQPEPDADSEPDKSAQRTEEHPGGHAAAALEVRTSLPPHDDVGTERRDEIAGHGADDAPSHGADDRHVRIPYPAVYPPSAKIIW